MEDIQHGGDGSEPIGDVTSGSNQTPAKKKKEEPHPDKAKLPQKRYYRQRAHSNPISDHNVDYPRCPRDMDWRPMFSTYNCPVEFADVGCGYGGLLVELSEMFPDRFMVGLELRVKVSDYVKDRIQALRLQHPGKYQNIACLRTNAMKYLPNYFAKGQLSKMFFLFPDPHFKKAKHKWRIITPTLLAEYAYVLREGGILYTVTDVRVLHDWMVQHLEAHPLFLSLTAEEMKADPVVDKILESTEEGKKVTRNKGEKFAAVYRRIKDPMES